MRRIAGVVSLALIVLLVGGCGSSSSGSSTSTSLPPSTTSVPATGPAPSDYDKYVSLAGALGGKVISKQDAATRAALNCSGAAKSMLGGVSIDNFPTDLALIRAYCPNMESSYR